jgi:hypothetical protein
LPSIHHLRYTDVEAQIVADAEIGIHAAIPTAHQNAPALIGVHAALPTVHQDAPALIATHAADASAHHAKYTDAEARAVHSPMSIPASCFVPWVDTYDFTRNNIQLRSRVSLTLQIFAAGLIFLNSITISKLTLFGYRDDGASTLRIRLLRSDFAGAVVTVADVIADWTDGYGSIYDASIDYAVVDIVNYFYTLELRIEPNDSVFDVRLLAAQIEFTG